MKPHPQGNSSLKSNRLDKILKCQSLMLTSLRFESLLELLRKLKEKSNSREQTEKQDRTPYFYDSARICQYKNVRRSIGHRSVKLKEGHERIIPLLPSQHTKIGQEPVSTPSSDGMQDSSWN